MLTAIGNTKLAGILRKIHQTRLHDKNARIEENEVKDLLFELNFELSIAVVRIEQLESCMEYIKKVLVRGKRHEKSTS